MSVVHFILVDLILDGGWPYQPEDCGWPSMVLYMVLILWVKSKSEMAAGGPKNGRGGLERCLTLGFWALWATFVKFVFCSEHSFYEKRSRWRMERKMGKMGGGMEIIGGEWKITSLLVERQNGHQMQCWCLCQYQPSAAMGHSLPATPEKSNMAAREPQNGRRGLERCHPLGFWHSKQLLLNKFFDPSTPSMRKGRDGEKQIRRPLLFC